MNSDAMYVGVTGGEMEYGPARDSISALELPPDSIIRHARGTKGYESRQRHINDFMSSDLDWLLMLDADMIFPPNTALQLLENGVTFVSGYYLFRHVSPGLRPVWFHPLEAGKWPMRPFYEKPDRNNLYELGASGWGALLIHRDVIADTREVLRDEPDVLEDDMDVWPYDLALLMRTLKELEQNLAAAARGQDTLEYIINARLNVDVLRDEFMPLRGHFQRDTVNGVPSMVGSDIRYGYYARQAGHVLYGDASVECGHVTQFNLQPSEFDLAIDAATPDKLLQIRADMDAAISELHDEYLKGLDQLYA